MLFMLFVLFVLFVLYLWVVVTDGCPKQYKSEDDKKDLLAYHNSLFYKNMMAARK